MASLEHVVRPVVVAGFRPQARVLPVDPNATLTEFKLEGGSSKPVEESFNGNTSITYSIKHKERDRTFDQIRVKNPDDNDQHVDVEVATQVKTHTYAGGSQPSRQKF